MRPSFLLPICLLLISAAAPVDASPPNVVFILADDLGWADTTLCGHTNLYQTPNLERLAARGMTFDRAYTSSPLCSPTRSAILTGLHPARTGLTTPNCHTPPVILQTTVGASARPNQKLLPLKTVTRLDPKYPTLSKSLKSAGYATAHFGKWHLGPEPYSPLQHGFDIDIPHHPGPGPAGSYVAPWKFKDFTENTPREHIEDRIGDEAAAFMKKHKNSPFFLNYWMFSVHGPFDAKAELIEKHRARIDPADEQRSPTYAAMIESLDDNVGKILDTIDRLGIAENTIIIFYSDNGGNMYNEIDSTTPTSNRPLRGGKGNNFDGGTRVPAVVVWPGHVKPGSRSNALITSTDFYPTILEMLGLTAKSASPAGASSAPPASDSSVTLADGISIVPALRGEPLDRPGDAIFTYFPHSTLVPDTLPPSVGMYQGDWKLLRLFHNAEDGAHEYRLYHLKDDIGETTNLAAQYPERVAAMDTAIEHFLEDTNAIPPLPNPDYDPANGALAKLGWHAGKNCTLALQDSTLILTPLGEAPNVRITPPAPVPAGAITLHLHLKTSSKGPFTIRWQEKGITPAFYRDRLATAKLNPSPDWQNLIIPFTAANPVLSLRLDPGKDQNQIEIDHLTIEVQGNEVHSWTFDD